MILDSVVKAKGELSSDLKIGRSCASGGAQSAEDLAKAYAYNGVTFGWNHIYTRLALDDIRKREKGLLERINVLETVDYDVH